MDLRQLRYFVTVAEELNFSRAALRLHMSQPPLSHQIKMLEEELGVVLLERNRREVKLTPAGRSFLNDSRALLDQAQIATRRVRLAGQGRTGSLRVGMATSAIDRVLPAFLNILRNRGVLDQVVLTDMGSEDQVRALTQERLDLGFVHARVVAKSLDRMPVHVEGLAIVLPKSHALAGRENLSLLDLADESMITFSRDHRSALFDSLIAACMNAGFSPRLTHVARHPNSMFQMVRCGLGVCVIPASYARSTDPELSVYPLPASSGVIQIDAIWHPGNTSSALQDVIELALPELKDCVGSGLPSPGTVPRETFRPDTDAAHAGARLDLTQNQETWTAPD